MKLIDSFFGLSHRFKVMILSEVFETITRPRWFSIYLKEDLRATDQDIGFIGAVQNGMNLILTPVGAPIGQKFNKKRLYLVSLLIQAFAFLIAFLAQDWTWAVFMSIVLGINAVVEPGISALVGRITDRATRATVFALEGTIMSIVAMLNSPLMGFIADTSGLRPQYLLAITGMIASFLIFAKFFPEIKEEEKKPKEKEAETQPKATASLSWREQIRQVFATPVYKWNFIGLIQAGVIYRLFRAGFLPFIDIYLYKEIGWSFVFFGFFGLVDSFQALVLRIPAGKLIDKYHLRRVFFFAGPAASGTMYLLFVFTRDPYQIATIFLVQSIIGTAHMLAVGALWYDAIPLEVYPIGVAIRGMIYGCSGMLGSLLGAYLWATLGAIASFYLAFATEIIRGFIALYMIRDIK